MKKLIAIALVLALTLSLAAASALTIAVPDDATNEGRALLLLQTYGYITLDENAGITATVKSITSNPKGIDFIEVAADMLTTMLDEVDYAIINNNYALDYDLNPVEQGLLIESADSPYVNVVSVKAGNEELPEVKALVAAVTSQQVVDYITITYGGSAVATVENPTDGYDATIDYEALAGKTIRVAATPVPHVEVLLIAKEILAAKNITLDITTVNDYKTPNIMVESGEMLANYFAHQPYQDEFNEDNATHMVTVAGIHVEPMAMYGGKQDTLDALNN